MTPTQRCRSGEHLVSRRRVLEGLAGVAAGLGLGGLVPGSASAAGAAAAVGKGPEKQMLLVWLDGGMSQLESWDPKPDTRYGGPFRSIATKIPGVHFSEVMPRLAARADRIAVVRSMKTEDPNHSSGVPKILRGEPKNRGVAFPYIGSALAKLMGPCASGLPPYVWVKPGSGGFVSKHAGFLGAKYGALALGNGKPPTNLVLPEGLSREEDEERNELRLLFEKNYAERRRPAWSEANSYVYDVARTLMRNAELFDEKTLSDADRDRYGRHDLGRHVLLGRRLIEAGVRFVHVQSYGWDSHGDNFNAHASRVPKVDQSVSALLDDLRDRGLLDRVLVVVMAEFGRTPRINGCVGRDHWPDAWSLMTAGCGIRPGTVVGRTLDDGTDVAGDPCAIGRMFHTWYRALGIDPKKSEFLNGTQPLPVAHEDFDAVPELLA